MMRGPIPRDVYIDLLEAFYGSPDKARLTYEDALADVAAFVHGYGSDREAGARRVAADLADMENERT